MTKAFLDETNAEIVKILAEASAKQNKETATANKADATQAGAAAEALIRQLAPSKQQAQAAHAAVKELDKGNAAGAAQLEQILTQLLTTTGNVAEKQMATFQKIFDALSKVEDTLSKQGNALNSLRNNHI